MRVPAFCPRPDYQSARPNARYAELAQSKWHKVGHLNVRFWVDEKGVIGSNLINALPPRAQR